MILKLGNKYHKEGLNQRNFTQVKLESQDENVYLKLIEIDGKHDYLESLFKDFREKEPTLKDNQPFNLLSNFFKQENKGIKKLISNYVVGSSLEKAVVSCVDTFRQLPSIARNLSTIASLSNRERWSYLVILITSLLTLTLILYFLNKPRVQAKKKDDN